MITSMQTKEALIYKNAVRVMEKNIYADLSVPEIAELCMVSKSTLKDIFSKYAGIGIHKYYLLMKINYSLSLLSEGYSVAEISASGEVKLYSSLALPSFVPASVTHSFSTAWLFTTSGNAEVPPPFQTVL